ncbi:MAG TPA: class I SAM-dependent methyltransferase [Acidimicrobiales bacterium]|nr:class I SAM-dependent methyltransferase [Acidimicrobiales bacterium]
MATPTAGWSDRDQVEWYLDRIGKLEPRKAGEAMLVDLLPPSPRRVLDLGCGDGRLAALVLQTRPTVEYVLAVDCSAPMLARAAERFDGQPSVSLREWDLSDRLPAWGSFDVVVSGFAIHHLEHVRKQQLFGEIVGQLGGGGLFINLEVVASATPERHAEFLAAIGRTADDPEDRLASVGDQLRWMREAGMVNVDCLWRWRGFAVLVGG